METDSRAGKLNLIVVVLPAVEDIRVTLGVVSTPANNSMLRANFKTETTGRPSILVVEDDAAVQASLCTILRTFGFTPFHADSVDEAIKVLECETIDAITLDVTLPDPSGSKRYGLSLLTHLRATRDHAHIPVLIFTDALLSDDDQAFARTHGAEVYYKPQPYYELASHLNWLLDRK